MLEAQLGASSDEGEQSEETGGLENKGHHVSRVLQAPKQENVGTQTSDPLHKERHDESFERMNQMSRDQHHRNLANQKFDANLPVSSAFIVEEQPTLAHVSIYFQEL